MIANEIPTARLLIQDPQHALAATETLLKHQSDPCTPKWLRWFQNAALAIDLAFIPIIIIGSVVSGGTATVPLMIMANSANFLWTGVALARERVAAGRYRILQRSLLTGTSEQVAKGLATLEKLHRNRAELIASGAIGSGMTIANLGIITSTARGGVGILRGAGTTSIDLSSGIVTDIGGVTSDDDPAELLSGNRGDTCLLEFQRAQPSIE